MPDLDIQTAFSINADVRRTALDDAVEAVKQELRWWRDTAPIRTVIVTDEALRSAILLIQDLQND
jgi:hypothetical protein